MRRRWMGAAGTVACLLPVVFASTARSCTLDGVPSLTVNGYDSVINKTPPIGKDLHLWAPFILSFPLHTGRTEALAEVVQRIPLRQEAYKIPWRWDFGDGTPIGRGQAVHHAYRKPGVYKILVSCYYPSHNFWSVFDALQVRVLPV